MSTTTTCGWDELKYIDYLKTRLPIAPTIGDFGFNVGDFTIEWLKRFPMSEVHGFEPITELYEMSRQRFEHSPNVKLYNWGVFNETCDKEIHFLQGQFHGMSSLFYRPKYYPKFELEKRMVHLKKFDEVADQFPKLDFAKFDLEGSEIFAFQGAKDYLIKHHPVIQFEIGECLEDARVTFKQIVDLLYSFEYRVFNRDFAEVSPSTVWEDYDCKNYLAIPKEFGVPA